MKGFETKGVTIRINPRPRGKKECPAMKGFETDPQLFIYESARLVRRNAPL